MTDELSTTRLERLLEEWAALADNFAVFLVTFLLLFLLGRYVLEPLLSGLLSARDVDPTLAQGIERVFGAAVVAVAFLLSLSTAGFDFLIQRLAILLAALTVALGFAAQDVVGNLVSGAFIVTDPKFNIGDWIRWDDREGVIEDISFRATRVRTFDNEVVTVPNSELTATAVTNPVLYDQLRLEIPVEINYDDDVDAAMEALHAAAADHPDVLGEPSPTVRITELGDAVRLSAWIWIAEPNRRAYLRIRSEYARDAARRLLEAGIDLGAATKDALEGELTVYAGDEGDGAGVESDDDGVETRRDAGRDGERDTGEDRERAARRDGDRERSDE